MSSFTEQGIVPSKQGFMQQSLTQQASLGMRLRLNDGREFQYCKNGAGALAAGQDAQSADTVSTHLNIAVAVAAAVGDVYVTVTLGATNAVIQNQYAEGYFVINAGAGIGHLYKIKSHPAAAAAASLKVLLYDPIVVALAIATSKVCLIKHQCRDVVIGAVAQTGHIVGIAPIAVTALYYFWAETKGMTASISGALVATAGKQIVTSGQTAGSVAVVDAYAEQVIGTAFIDGVSAEARPIFLDIV